MDVGDCNNVFLISFSEDNPWRLTYFLLILSQTAIRRHCVQPNQYRQGIDGMKENLRTAPDNPSMGNINDIIASTLEKLGVIRNSSGNCTERTTKVSQLILYFIQLCQGKIYFTHAVNCPNTNPTGMPTIH